jgi:hypothetical protein
MQKGHLLQFNCLKCKNPLKFSIFELDNHNGVIQCDHCEKKYALSDETLKRQLRKFAALCEQLVESEEILSQTAIGIDIGDRHVKIPYKLLLTRLNSTLDLKFGTETVSIVFRMEPLKDCPVTA